MLGTVVEYRDTLHYPHMTIHGRFQPPLHLGHWVNFERAFRIADNVHVLITNPDCHDKPVTQAAHRSSPNANPFTYEERVYMFQKLFAAKGIAPERYSFTRFDVTSEEGWKQIANLEMPHLMNAPHFVNVYSPWSAKKLELFVEHGCTVVRGELPRLQDISGSHIREIIMSGLEGEDLKKSLLDAGFVPEAIPGLFEVLAKRKYAM